MEYIVAINRNLAGHSETYAPTWYPIDRWFDICKHLSNTHLYKTMTAQYVLSQS